MGFFSDWVISRATKKMAMTLPQHLATAYGGGDFYTKPQIDISYKLLKLNPKFIAIAYAEFLEFADYQKYIQDSREEYDQARKFYSNFKVLHMDSEASPAPINSYVKQMTGLN